MKRAYFIPVLAVAFGIMMAFMASSFTTAPVKKTLPLLHYFKFSTSVPPTEANLEDASRWTFQAALPGSNPCISGSVAPCIAHADHTLTGIDGDDSDLEKVSKFVAFLASIRPLDPDGATEFMKDLSNVDFRRQ